MLLKGGKSNTLDNWKPSLQSWNSVHEMCIDEEELTKITKETKKNRIEILTSMWRLTIGLNGCDHELICPIICPFLCIFFTCCSFRTLEYEKKCLCLHISSLLILFQFSFSIVSLFSRLYSHILDFRSVHYFILMA